MRAVVRPIDLPFGRRVLVVSAERMSGLLDWTDRGTCCIFGDGAGAVVLGEGNVFIASELHT